MFVTLRMSKVFCMWYSHHKLCVPNDVKVISSTFPDSTAS